MTHIQTTDLNIYSKLRQVTPREMPIYAKLYQEKRQFKQSYTIATTCYIYRPTLQVMNKKQKNSPI